MLSNKSHSTAFRTAALTAALVALVGLLLSVFLYKGLTDEFLKPVRLNLENQAAHLTQAADLKQEVDTIQDRLHTGNDDLDAETFAILFDQQGKRIAGANQINTAFLGWKLWNTPVVPASSDTDSDTAETAPALAYGVAVPEGTLVVGKRLPGLGETQEIFVRVLGVGIAGMCLAAIGIGWFLSRTAMRRIDQAASAARSFAEGNHEARLPVAGLNDDIDQLAGSVNSMMETTTQVMSAMKNVSWGIAHELKSPLTRLRQQLEILQSQKQVKGADLGQLENHIDSAISVFDGLLRIAHISSGERRRKFASLDLGKIAGEVVELHQAQAESRKQQLILDASLVRVTGDEVLLKQLVSILMDNAIKHCPEGARIEITAKADAGSACLIVGDNGPGIADSDHASVFEPFRRGSAAQLDTPGTGLGLATAKAIADLHLATISLGTNQPGLQVTVHFPGNSN